jgi:cell wall-associated NlpC family hydrolase
MIEQRQRVIDAALSWVGTPYHPGAVLKGVGVDCGMLLIAVYKEAGMLDQDFDPRPYPAQWHMHQAAERYLDYVASFTKEVESSTGPGDIVLFKWGKCFSHGAIVIDWPMIIHAMAPHNVGPMDVSQVRKIDMLPRRFFTPWM